MANAHLLSEEDFEVGNTGLGGTRRYLVTGAADSDEAYDAAVDQMIADGYTTYFGIPIGTISGRHLGGGVYEISIVYDPNARTLAPDGSGNTPAGSGGAGSGGGENPDAEMPREWTLTTGGGTRHITRSVATTYAVKKFNVPIAPWGDNGLIGSSENGVAGLDVIDVEPVIRWNDRVATVTIGYFHTMCRMTAKVNLYDWKGFFAGELLCCGVDLNYKDGDAWERSVTLKYSKNQGSVPWEDAPGIGNNDAIVIIPGDPDPEVDTPILQIDPVVYRKPGWHHIDVRYKKVPNEQGTGMTLEPTHLYVHKVYDEIDFDNFQL